MRLAELMGVSFTSVNRWENGQTRLTQMAWRKIARAEESGVEALKSDALDGDTVREPEVEHTAAPKAEVNSRLSVEPADDHDVKIRLVIETNLGLDKRECEQVIESLNKILRSASVKVGFLDET